MSGCVQGVKPPSVSIGEPSTGNSLLAPGAGNYDVVMVDLAVDALWINAAPASAGEVQLAMVEAEPDLVPAARLGLPN